jgi:hypothetical protein
MYKRTAEPSTLADLISSKDDRRRRVKTNTDTTISAALMTLNCCQGMYYNKENPTVGASVPRAPVVTYGKSLARFTSKDFCRSL